MTEHRPLPSRVDAHGLPPAPPQAPEQVRVGAGGDVRGLGRGDWTAEDDGSSGPLLRTRAARALAWVVGALLAVALAGPLVAMAVRMAVAPAGG